MRYALHLPAVLLFSFAAFISVDAQDYTLHKFERQQLTDVYYSEGANAGDVNGDGKLDVVYGPYWYAGPDFKTKHEIYPAKPQNRERYANNFFNWVYDFNGDGRNDVLVVGFPGTPAYVYENPGPGNYDKPWKKHEILKSVANESPQFVTLLGKGPPALVCSSNGFFGFGTFAPGKGFEPWTFHVVSTMDAPKQFGHGLGIGDINGDGLQDILTATGWFEQPSKSADSMRWEFHRAPFTPHYGGAEMYVYDVDGDGLNDVITSLAAHDFGLAWYKQVKANGKSAFQKKLIMGDKPADNPFGVLFSELHSVHLVDMDGDGLKDIITGKTYYSHHKQSPMWDAGAVVYWFKLVRTSDGVQWIPHKIDDKAGIGRQISIADIDGDQLLDVVVGGMVGAHVLRHKTQRVSKEEWEAAQPKLMKFETVSTVLGPKSSIDEATGKVAGAIEGEDLKVATLTKGRTTVQNMGGFKADRWSGNAQLFWTGGKPGNTLTLSFEVPTAGTHDVSSVMTMARDYAIVQFAIDDVRLGKPVDLYNSDVITSGVLPLGTVTLKEGSHRLNLTITGANPAATQSFMVGLDYILIKPSK